MPWIAAVAGAAGQLGSSVIAANEQANAREQALSLAQQSVNDLNAIGVPPEQAMQITLQKMQSAGMLTPELEQAITQGNTELKNISTDPRLQDAQMQALDELRQRGAGGYTVADRAALQQGLDQVNAQERGNRQAIMQDMAARGMSGSGAQLASELSNQQNAAQNANQVGLGVAGQGYNNAMQALAQSGQLAGQMQNTSFGQQAQVASAQDVINRMNTQAQQQAQAANVQAQNAAQQWNLANQQNISNANTGLANEQEMYNKNLAQQNFQNQLGLAQAKAGARAGQAQTALGSANSLANTIAGAGAGMGQIGMGVSKYQYANQGDSGSQTGSNGNSNWGPSADPNQYKNNINQYYGS